MRSAQTSGAVRIRKSARRRWLRRAVMGASCLLIGVAMAPAAHAQNDIANGTAVPDGAYPWAYPCTPAPRPRPRTPLQRVAHRAQLGADAQHCFDTNLDGTPNEREPTCGSRSTDADQRHLSWRGDPRRGCRSLHGERSRARPIGTTVERSDRCPGQDSTDPRKRRDTCGMGTHNDTGARPDNMQQGQFMVWLPIGAKMML